MPNLDSIYFSRGGLGIFFTLNLTLHGHTVFTASSCARLVAQVGFHQSFITQFFCLTLEEAVAARSQWHREGAVTTQTVTL